MIVLDIKDREWRNRWLLQFKAILALQPPPLPRTCPWLDTSQITVTQTRVVLTLDQLMVLV